MLDRSQPSCRRFVVGVAAAAVLAVSCGGADDDAAGDDEPVAGTAVTTTTVPVPATTAVRWTTVDDIPTIAPEQALPEVDDFAGVLRAENEGLGATDLLDHASGDAVSQVTLTEGACTDIGFVSYSLTSTAPLTEGPSVGVLAPTVRVFVCADSEALDAQSSALLEFNDGNEAGECVYSDIEPGPTGTRICSWRDVASGDVSFWESISFATVDRALVAVTASFGPDTELDRGARSMVALVDAVTANIEARL